MACAALALATAVSASGCGRTPLMAAHQDAADAPTDQTADVRQDMVPDRARDQAVETPIDREPDRAPDLMADGVPDVVVSQPPDAGTVCRPQAEVCNGLDDDCDGQIDQGLAPIPCDQGGSRYCVAGRWSECPRRCEVCIPGSSRVCFITFCMFWGEQSCAADGRSFGPCRESPAPAACDSLARAQKRSPALEQCCLDNDYCCRDEFDLNHDGDVTDMLGRCEAVTCGP